MKQEQPLICMVQEPMVFPPASKGTATNAGEINVDGFVPIVDENGNIIDETYWQTNSVYLMGGGMLAGPNGYRRR